MNINFTLDWKTILKLIGGAIFGWLIRHLLDRYKSFEFLETQYEEHDIKGKVVGLLGTQVTILDILIFLVLATIGYLILNWIFKKLFSKEERLKKNVVEIQKFNTKTLGQKTFKWTVGFNNNRPTIQSLRVYCANHNPVLPMTYDQPLEMYRCQSCANNLTKPFIPQMGTYNNDYSRLLSVLQAELEEKWEQLNQQ